MQQVQFNTESKLFYSFQLGSGSGSIVDKDNFLCIVGENLSLYSWVNIVLLVYMLFAEESITAN